MADPGERPRSTFRFPRVEFDLAALVLGALAVLGTSAIWMLLAWALGVPGDRYVLAPSGPLRPGEAVAVQADPAIALRSEFAMRLRPYTGFPGAQVAWDRIGFPGPLVKPVQDDPAKAQPAPLDLEPWKLVVAAFGLLTFWSIAGGSISRVYAVRKARDRTVPFDEALGFAFGSLRQFLLAPCFIAAAAALFFGLVAAAGAATAIPFAGPVLQVLLLPLALVAGLVVTVVVVGGVLGFPMTQAAVAVERNGALDAVSRTYSYVFTRPLTFAFGCLVVLAVGSVIPAFAEWYLDVVRSGLALGASWDADGAGRAIALGLEGASRMASPRVPEGAGTAVAVWAWGTWGVFVLAVVLLKGFVISYVVGGFVDVYFTLREEVDGVPVGEVYEAGVDASLGEPVAGQPVHAAPRGDTPGGDAPGGDTPRGGAAR